MIVIIDYLSYFEILFSIYIIIIIIKFKQYCICQGNYRRCVAYRDNYPFINMISFIKDKNNK